jgi:diguanylate cyclase (GGDEF)-like protein/PAS domain S-box-containing protein
MQAATYLGLAMILLLWTSVYFQLQREHAAARTAATQSSSNLARAFEENVIRSIKGIDKTLLFLRSVYEKGNDSTEWYKYISDAHAVGELTLLLSIIDERGILKESSAAAKPVPAIDLSDREHFKVHVNATRDELFIGKPVTLRTTGQSSVQLTRRLRARDGSFAGIIGASLDPEQFARFYESIDIGKDGAITLVGFDGAVRGHAGQRAAPLGADLSATPLFSHYRKAAAGSYVDSSRVDDGMLVSYRVVKDLPLIVTVALSEREIFASYWRKVRSYSAIAAGLTGLILLVAGAGARHRARLDRARQALLQSEAQNRRQSQQLQVTLDHMSQGLCMFDAEQRVVVSNDRYARMYGLSPAQVKPGTSLRRIVEYRIDKGIFAGSDPQEYMRERLTPVQTASDSVQELSDGRAIAIARRPLPDGGWVTTHDDWTLRRLAEKQLEQARAFLDIVIENVPLPIVVKEANTLRFVLVNRAYEAFIGLPRASLIGQTVREIFPPEDADRIINCDREASISDKRVIVAEFSVRTPVRGLRTVTTTRLVVRDEKGGLSHLIAVIEDITDRRESEKKILYMAHHDSLTGLPNRALLRERLDQGVMRVERGESLAVLCLDLDDFKTVNDTLGHPVGDALLKIVAERLCDCIRETDTVARFGGDEFAILQTATKSLTDVTTLARRIVEAIHAPFDVGNHQVTVGVSIGIAVSPGDGVDPVQLLKNADLALYRAKAEGRGSYRFFEPEMDTHMRARRALEIDLRKALVNGEFEMYYQPLVNLQRNEVCGFEALLRWHHPERGTVFPVEFISVAEEIGLIAPIGEWALRQACAQAARWPGDLKIAVNLSSTQFKSPNLVQMVVNALAAAGLPGRRLELEITESALLQNNAATLAAMHQLRELGVQISMDDFGTGYSSLGYLQTFPFDKIKIDRSFISNLANGQRSVAILRAIVSLADSLGMTTIAEGVERQEQLEMIRAEGCTEMQGHLFSPARPAEDVARLFLPRFRRGQTAA